MAFVLQKDDPFLVIVESPNKKATISEILKKAGYKKAIVAASVGHIMELADDKDSWKNTGIYPDKNFSLNLRINSEKQKVVSQLKAQVASVKYVFVASDPDREGHVIAWSLCRFLDLDPGKNAFRMVTHEITPKAVIHALENPIPFDDNMTQSGLARWAVDKAIGYALSQWLRLYVGGKSAGRCVSAAGLILALRENEITSFVPETFFDLFLYFIKSNLKFKAKYIGTEQNPIKHLNTLEEVENVVNSLSSDFIVKNVQKKEKKENPKPPFDTISFQQEAANKLNLKVKDAQSCAQKLFEGIEVNHQHIGLVTYIRTDATDMSPEFIPILRDYVETTYGKGTFNTPRVGKKQDNQQDGHECLRVTDPSMTPDLLAKYVKNDLLIKVYRLIWQRTIASAMPPAIISETTYLIENNGHLFSLVSNELVSPGYKSIYSYKDEDEKDDDGPVKETFKKNEKLTNCSIESDRKQTTPPPRFKEPTFIKELKKEGIGRPSTTAGLVEKTLSENLKYCTLDNKEMCPTQLGLVSATTLNRCFPDLIGIEVTRNIEKSLDLISEGKLSYVDFLTDFFANLNSAISKNSEGVMDEEERICPDCGAKLVLRRGKYAKSKPFYGCSNYPRCRHTENK